MNPFSKQVSFGVSGFSTALNSSSSINAQSNTGDDASLSNSQKTTTPFAAFSTTSFNGFSASPSLSSSNTEQSTPAMGGSFGKYRNTPTSFVRFTATSFSGFRNTPQEETQATRPSFFSSQSADTSTTGSRTTFESSPLVDLATSTYNPNRPSTFIDKIPSEVRVLIYQYLFANATVHVKSRSLPGSLSKRSSLSAILQVCRLCYDEARGPFYSTVTFEMAHCWGLIPNPMLPEQLTTSPFTLDATGLVKHFTFKLRDFKYMPKIHEMYNHFPSLQFVRLTLTEHTLLRLPFGFVEDVSTVMKKAAPMDINGQVPVKYQGTLLRWLSKVDRTACGFVDSLRPVFEDMWQWTEKEYNRHPDQAADGFNFQIEFQIPYRQCVLYFDCPHFDSLDSNRDPPTPKQDPKWAVNCIFDARDWAWIFEVGGKAWHCEEMLGDCCICWKCIREVTTGEKGWDLAKPRRFAQFEYEASLQFEGEGAEKDGKHGVRDVRRQLAALASG